MKEISEMNPWIRQLSGGLKGQSPSSFCPTAPGKGHMCGFHPQGCGEGCPLTRDPKAERQLSVTELMIQESNTQQEEERQDEK